MFFSCSFLVATIHSPTEVMVTPALLAEAMFYTSPKRRTHQKKQRRRRKNETKKKTKDQTNTKEEAEKNSNSNIKEGHVIK